MTTFHFDRPRPTGEALMPERWRHKKRGTVYEIVTHDASLQCSAALEFEQLFDEDTFTVYRSVETGATYVRPTPEFMDGRFEQLPEEKR